MLNSLKVLILARLALPRAAATGTVAFLKALAFAWMPLPVTDALLRWRNSRTLASVPCVTIDPGPLPKLTEIASPDTFRDEAIANEWTAARAIIREALVGTDPTSEGTSPKDSRALWYWTRRFEPRAVLEIGTGSGVSTAHFAAALKAGSHAPSTRLVTVDIMSPGSSVKHALARLGCLTGVEFVTDRSLSYLAGREDEFDFIFLDGDHSAANVYQEIPLALKALRPGGGLMLHDYYWNREAMRENYWPMPGPCLAVARLRQENGGLAVAPGDTLPWPDALGLEGSGLTCALLARE